MGTSTQYPILTSPILPSKLQAGAPKAFGAWVLPLAEPVLPAIRIIAAIVAGSFFLDTNALANAGSPTLEIPYPLLSEPVLPQVRLDTASQWYFKLDTNALATAGSPTFEIKYPPLSGPVLPLKELSTANEWSFEVDRDLLATGGSPAPSIIGPAEGLVSMLISIPSRFPYVVVTD